MATLYVEPEHRGKGLAVAVVTQLSQLLLADDVDRVVLVDEDNVGSVAVHLKCGFKKVPGCNIAHFLFEPK